MTLSFCAVRVTNGAPPPQRTRMFPHLSLRAMMARERPSREIIANCCMQRVVAGRGAAAASDFSAPRRTAMRYLFRIAASVVALFTLLAQAQAEPVPPPAKRI